MEDGKQGLGEWQRTKIIFTWEHSPYDVRSIEEPPLTCK
ncbi:uncharacterized protein G2W53_016480 [Senna tora]|uniref:Uncharacterized protein n=1 Tax=Senna tora TaxID=362788 RepID=A0A834TQY0_9FABA|nr:uncharacterized protein G2W53_016480 [Senna tora]